MPRGGRNVPSLQQRFALKGKMLVKYYRGQLVVQAWPKPYGKPRSQAQADTITAFKRVQRALKFLPPAQTIGAMELTAKTGMYPRDLLMQAMAGTNVLLSYAPGEGQAMIGDALQKFVSTGVETTVDWSNIPPGYSSLLITGNVRSLQAATAIGLFMDFNADNSSSYVYETWDQTGTVGPTAFTEGLASSIIAASMAASYPSPITVLIPGYSNAVFFKSWLGHSSFATAIAAGSISNRQVQGWWKRTDPISRIRFNIPTKLVAGSQLTLYGMF